MHCPKHLEKYVKDYSEKKGYENVTSKFYLSDLKDEKFNLKFIGNLEKNILFGFSLKPDDNDHLSIIAIKNNLELLLFDNTKNGYSNCFENSNLSDFNTEEYCEFHCLKCSGNSFSISLFYEYIDENILREEEIELPDYSNSFQWIRISAKCCSCGKEYKNIIDYED